ncbi:hypothetical protein evm_013169 [Chilo suppressalis]|nr:hypothetical protein evm_013169 [Chilo suppressalis]
MYTKKLVTVADSICQECINLIIVNLSNNNEDNSVAQQFGHQSVCVCCGLSISRRSGRHSRPLLNEHPERAYIANIINPRQISANARACNACWQRAHYHSIRELIEPPQIVSVETLESESSSVVVEPVSVSSSEFAADIEIETESRHINLDGYCRTSDTSTHCFVPDCMNHERLRVPLYLKKKN